MFFFFSNPWNLLRSLGDTLSILSLSQYVDKNRVEECDNCSLFKKMTVIFCIYAFCDIFMVLLP